MPSWLDLNKSMAEVDRRFIGSVCGGSVEVFDCVAIASCAEVNDFAAGATAQAKSELRRAKLSFLTGIRIDKDAEGKPRELGAGGRKVDL